MNSMKKILLLIIVGIFVAGSSDVYAMDKSKKAKERAKLAILKAKAAKLKAQASAEASSYDDEEADVKPTKKAKASKVADEDEEEGEESEEDEDYQDDEEDEEEEKTPARRKTSGRRAAASASWCSASKVLGIGAVSISALMLYLLGSGYYYDSGALPPGDYTGLWMSLIALGLGGAGAHALRS